MSKRPSETAEDGPSGKVARLECRGARSRETLGWVDGMMRVYMKNDVKCCRCDL